MQDGVNNVLLWEVSGQQQCGFMGIYEEWSTSALTSEDTKCVPRQGGTLMTDIWFTDLCLVPKTNCEGFPQ